MGEQPVEARRCFGISTLFQGFDGLFEALHLGCAPRCWTVPGVSRPGLRPLPQWDGASSTQRLQPMTSACFLVSKFVFKDDY